MKLKAMNRAVKAGLTVAALLLIAIEAPAYTTLISSSDSDAFATAEFKKVISLGGTITFEAGSWNINLGSSSREALADVTIIGANTVDAGDPDKRGAYEGAHVQTTITLSGNSLAIMPGCTNLVIRNVRWNRAGIDVVSRHQPVVDIDNVLFDISSWNKGLWGKIVIDTHDGVQGEIHHTTFRGYGIAGIYIYRTISNAFYPYHRIGKLTIDRCQFDPDTAMRAANKVGSVAHDAGNDEYAPTLDHDGKEIKNSLFVDCRISFSKGSNCSISNNIFEFTDAPNDLDAFHLEEFSYNISIQDNTFRLLGANSWKFMTIGALQPCHDITVSGNTVEQTGQLSAFITGAGVENISITSNEVQNPVLGADYINFWGGNNLNVEIGPNQLGLGPDHQSISSSILTGPLSDGTYYMVWGTNQYLSLADGQVKFVEHASPPDANQYKWTFTEERMGYIDNTYTVQNMGDSEFYLEVRKGPTAPEQVGSGVPYIFEGSNVTAKAAGSYAEFDRRPCFALFESAGKFCLLPGMNEKRSDLRKDGEGATVYIVTDETDAEYGWSLISTKVLEDVAIAYHQIVGGDIILGVTNGPANSWFTLFSKTNLMDATWATNQSALPLDAAGAGSVTNTIASPREFYRIIESNPPPPPEPEAIDFTVPDYVDGGLNGQQNWNAESGWTVGDSAGEGYAATPDNSSAAVLNDPIQLNEGQTYTLSIKFEFGGTYATPTGFVYAFLGGVKDSNAAAHVGTGSVAADANIQLIQNTDDYRLLNNWSQIASQITAGALNAGDDLQFDYSITMGDSAATTSYSARLQNLSDGTDTGIGAVMGVDGTIYNALAGAGAYGFFQSINPGNHGAGLSNVMVHSVETNLIP